MTLFKVLGSAQAALTTIRSEMCWYLAIIGNFQPNDDQGYQHLYHQQERPPKQPQFAPVSAQYWLKMRWFKYEKIVDVFVLPEMKNV